MKFSKPLLEGILLQRYKRFFADVEYQNQVYTVHVPNTGSLKGVIEKNPTKPQKCWFTLHGDPSKKTKGTLEAVCVNSNIDKKTWVGVNTSNPNKIVSEAVNHFIASKQEFLPHWTGYHFYKPEFKINKESRLDGALCVSPEDADDPSALKHFIEIKNCTYKVEINDESGKLKHIAQFPDAVTERGQKHIQEMRLLMKQGHKCEIIFTVQRSDCDYFSAAKEIDPKYAELLSLAKKEGLIISPLKVELNQSEIQLTNQILSLID